MFTENIAAVGGQVAALFAMMSAGWILYRVKMLTETGVAQMTDLLLWVATPCLLVDVFSREFSSDAAVSLLMVAVAGAVFMLAALGAGQVIFRGKKDNPNEQRGVLSFASAFSNCGFMGIPLADALYGKEGVMYASAFVIAFNLVQWTAGCAVMSGGKLNIKKMLVNPGVVGIAVSLPVFLFSIKIPAVIMLPISSVAAMNTPLAMVVIGGYLAKADLRGAVKNMSVYAVSLMRLVAVPLIAMLFLWAVPLPMSHTAAVTLLVELAAPAAASTVMVAALTGRDAELAGQLVAVTTLLSAVTMPLIVTAGEKVLMHNA
ncbi:MAG: AEC family transporter [Oscillospiraceae bacterium]|nr:AEC family transporter [Oscillospiraceae bacterium]